MPLSYTENPSMAQLLTMEPTTMAALFGVGVGLVVGLVTGQALALTTLSRLLRRKDEQLDRLIEREHRAGQCWVRSQVPSEHRGDDFP
jgi:hypothetical protein